MLGPAKVLGLGSTLGVKREISKYQRRADDLVGAKLLLSLWKSYEKLKGAEKGTMSHGGILHHW